MQQKIVISENDRVQVWVSTSAKASAEYRAKQAGMTLSAYVSELLLNAETRAQRRDNAKKLDQILVKAS